MPKNTPESTVTRRRFLGGTLLGLGGLAAASLTGRSLIAAAEAKRPNIVFIVTDDQEFESIGAYGGKVLTPHIDSLARDGVRFTRAYATTPVCTPSRYACLTGQFASRCDDAFFLEKNPYGTQSQVKWDTELKERGAVTVASLLRQAGYRTGFVGKWHNGPRSNKPHEWEEAGFEQYPRDADPADPAIADKLEHNQRRMSELVKARGFDYAESIYWGNIPQMKLNALHRHNQEWITKGALDFIDTNRDKPFFLYMATTLEHGPNPLRSLKSDPRITGEGMLDEPLRVQPSRESVLERVKKAGLPEAAAPSTWLDDGVGAVLRKLRELNLEKDTLVIFFNDHGNKHKATLYEGGVRTPCLMRYPRKVKPGQVCEALVANIDFLPTMLEASGADIEPPERHRIDGKSLVPLATGEVDALRDDLYLEIGFTRAIVTPRYKYLAVRIPEGARKPEGKRYHVNTCVPIQKRVEPLHPGYWDADQLYDLEKDPRERTNLAADPEYRKTVDDMKRRLDRYMKTFRHHFGEFPRKE